MSNILPQRRDLIKTGRILQDFINKTTSSNPHIQYLLIIEGQASRINQFITMS